MYKSHYECSVDQQSSLEMIRQVVFVAVALSVVLASDVGESLQKMKEECVKELGYEETKKKPDEMTAEDRKRHNCLSKCLYIKDGMISEDGVINVEKFKERASASSKDKVDAAAETCKDKTGGDECTKIAAKLLCMFDIVFPRKTKN